MELSNSNRPLYLQCILPTCVSYGMYCTRKLFTPTHQYWWYSIYDYTWPGRSG